MAPSATGKIEAYVQYCEVPPAFVVSRWTREPAEREAKEVTRGMGWGGLAAGTYQVSIRKNKEGPGPPPAQNVEVRAGEDANVRFTLPGFGCSQS